MHRTELIIALLGFCFLLLGVIWLLSGDTDHRPDQKSDLAADQTAQEFSLEQGTHKKTVDQVQPTPKMNHSLQEMILQEIADRQFSQDPYTEVLSLQWMLNHCRNNPEVDEIAAYYGITYPIHKQMNNTVKSNCERYQQHYPVLMKSFKDQQWTTPFQPQNELGYLLKALLDRNVANTDQQALSRLALLAAIREQNSIVLTSFQDFTNSNMKAHLFPVTDLLRSHDYQYTYHVNQVAINLISCQFNQGISCESNSPLMQHVCAKNPMACGLDYQAWYQNNTLAGMRQDVEKLMAFYAEKAAEQGQ